MKKIALMFALACAVATSLVLGGCAPSYDEHVSDDDVCKILIVAKDWDPERAPSYIVQTTNRNDKEIVLKLKDNKVRIGEDVLDKQLRENAIEVGKTSTQYLSFPVEQYPTPDDVTNLELTFEVYDTSNNLLASYNFVDPKPEE